MKPKKETIKVLVEFEISYDPRSQNAKDYVTSMAVKEMPINLTGASVNVGGYSIVRGKSTLAS